MFLKIPATVQYLCTFIIVFTLAIPTNAHAGLFDFGSGNSGSDFFGSIGNMFSPAPFSGGDSGSNGLADFGGALMGGLVDSLGGQLLGSGLGNFGSLLNPSTGPNAGITSMLGGLADKSNLPINFENFGIGTGIDGLGANYPSNVVFNPSAKKNEYGLKDSARKALIEVAVKLPDLTITVTSTFRSEAHNKDADGAEKSQHIQGRAIDVSVGGSLDNRVALAQAISTTGSVRGWGVYSSGSMHFDTRPGGKAYWSDDFGSGSFDRFAKNGTIEKEISSLVYAWHGGKIPPSTDVIDLDSFLTS